MKIIEPTLSITSLRELTVMRVWDEDPNVPSLGSALGVGRAKAYDLARSGAVPTVRIGTRVMIPVPALLRWLGDESSADNGLLDARSA